MNRISILVLVAFAIAAIGCSSGSGDDPIITPSFSASFLAEEPNPEDETVSAHEGVTIGSLVTVEIRVTGTNDIYGATFDLIFDPSMVNYVDFTEGSLLEQGGQSPDYVVVQPQSGQLLVTVTRQGNVPGVDASGTVTLIGLTFEVFQEGSSVVFFTASELLDDQPLPQPIPNLEWFGGALTGT
jgi:hypothetical protein